MKVTAIGILVVDLIAAGLPKVAAPGEVIFTPRGIKTRLGGHPANVSIDLVKLGLEGDEVAVVGAVGEDIHGEFVERTLQSYGIKTYLQRVRDVETSKNLILVVKGEDRRFHPDVGANCKLSAEHVKRTIGQLRSKIFYVGATGWLGEVDDTLPEILGDVKGRGMLTFVDIIAPYGKPWSYILPALESTDIFHGNLTEVSNVTGKSGLEESAEALNKMGVALALVTLGEEGLYARTRRWSIRLDAFKVDAIDPTGAGDAFCAAIIHHLITENVESVEEIDAEKALDMLIYASAVGASATTKEGTTAGVSPQFIENLIEEQGKELRERAEIKLR